MFIHSSFDGCWIVSLWWLLQIMSRRLSTPLSNDVMQHIRDEEKTPHQKNKDGLSMYQKLWKITLVRRKGIM